MSGTDPDEFSYRCVCGAGAQIAAIMAGRLVICPRCSIPVILPSVNGESARQFSVSLSTPRLALELAKPGDWRRILPISSDPENYHFELSEPDTEASLRRSLKQCRFPQGFRKSGIMTMLATRKSDGELLGMVYLTLGQDYLQGALGIKIHHTYHRMGFGSEAAGAVVDFGLHTLNLHRISAACDAANTACIKLLESVGFKQEGFLEQWTHHPRRGWIDCCLYRRLASDSAPG